MTAFLCGFIGVLLTSCNYLFNIIRSTYFLSDTTVFSYLSSRYFISYIVVAVLFGLYGFSISISHKIFKLNEIKLDIISIIKSGACQIVSLLILFISFRLIMFISYNFISLSEIGFIFQIAVSGAELLKVGTLQAFLISIFFPLIIGIGYYILFRKIIISREVKTNE